MKHTSFDEKKPFSAKRGFRRPRGFALVISLSLMVLLTVLAVGLLSLSTVSVRSSSQADAMHAARSNARLALMLAIGQLQKNGGPDQRISAPANLVDKNLPQGVAGLWKSWRPPSDGTGDYESEKLNRFAGYVMSAPSFTKNSDPSQMPGTGSPMQIMLGEGSLGGDSKDRQVSAPIVSVGKKGTPDSGSMAWVAFDEGVKGRIDLLPEKESSTATLGKNITRLGSSPRNKAGKFEGLETLAADAETLNATLPKLVSTDEVNLMASNKDAFGKYFHDFSVTSSSVQSDAANGGLKTDLSVLFDSPSLPSDYANRRVYSGTTTPFAGGTAADPLWGIYQHHYRLYQRTTTNDNPRDGLKNYVGSRYKLSEIADPTGQKRYEPDMRTMTESVIMPTIAKVDIVFSLVVRDVHGGRAAGLKAAGYPFMLHMMYLPVITLHNPFNVPLRFTQLEIEFEDLPMGFQFFVGGQAATSSMQAFNQLYVGKEGGSIKKIFKLVLTGDLNANREVVMGAGETRIFGKPFPPTWKWDDESAGAGADGTLMFDWRNDKTGKEGNRIMPGLITGPNDGIGYDIDWLAATNRQPWLTSRTGEGIIPVKGTESISVQYGPKSQASTPGSFAVTMRLTPGNTANNYSKTQIFFKDDARLKQILEEGQSIRFPFKRTFPETYPKPGTDLAKTADALHEKNSEEIRNYVKAKAFAVFSLSGKTTRDSFTKSRPVADTGATFQMATCDFTTSASQGSSPYEFVLTPVRNGEGGVQADSSLVKGYFFGGHNPTLGTTGATFYEIPQAPLQSIAQMRHANAASLGTAPYFTYSVGESRAHPAMPVNSVKFAPDRTRTMLDHSWLANDALWDRYWFSTLATLQGTSYTGNEAIAQAALASAFFNGERNLPNPRNTPYLTASTTAAAAATGALAVKTGANTGAYVMTKGGFNVNSVSKAAWISVLSALSNSSIPLAAGTLEQTGDDVPTLRVRRPTGGLKDGRPLNNQLWNSYRKLTPGEIDKLAEEIVVEVRERGPFLSMSEFVNRRLTSGDLAQKGALQAAIDRSKLNDVMQANATTITTNDVSTYNWRNPAAVNGTNTGAGSPGEISQGDLLSAIGSFAMVRSDTFRIRAFGDARDKNDKVLARAWCEATVQRLPDYVDATDRPEVAADKEANKLFGRRFSVVAFRWLHPDEV